MDGSIIILASRPWLLFQVAALAAASGLAVWRARRSNAGLVVLLLGVLLNAVALLIEAIGEGPSIAGVAACWVGGALELAGLSAGLLGLTRRHAYVLAAALAVAGLLSFAVAVAALG